MILDELPLDLYTLPEDGGNDSLVWSTHSLIAPNSYMNLKVFLDNLVGDSPPPTYLTY